MSVTDEMYIGSMLALLGVINTQSRNTTGIDHKHVLKKRLTYCDWSKNERSPETYTSLTAALVFTALSEGCLFLRKLKIPSQTTLNEKSTDKKRPYDEIVEQPTRNQLKLGMLENWLEYVLHLSPSSDIFKQYIDAAVDIVSISSTSCMKESQTNEVCI